MKQNAKQQALLHLLELLEKSELTEKHIVLLLSTAGNWLWISCFFYVSKEKDDEDELRDG